MNRFVQRWVCGWALFTCSLISVCELDASELQLRITDAESGQSLPARVRIRDAAGKDHAPTGSVIVRIGTTDQWFVCDGRVQIDVPAGKVTIRVEHGTEYSPYKGEVVAGETTTLKDIPLRRWIDMRRRGYVCGENHLHVDTKELGPQLIAEGMDFGNSLQWWNGPKFEVPPGDGFIRRLRYADREVPVSVYDFEIEHEWGAVYASGLPEPLKQESRSKRPNLTIVRAAHEAGALVSYQAGYSREVLLDALLGCVDVVNICSNNFLRHRFQPRSRYSNMLNVEGFPIYPDTAEGMLRLSAVSYYRLLNCGLRLAAGAESATGAKSTPVGYNRTYVRAGEAPTLPAFLEAWRAGRNFVTCGPMLFLTVEGKREPGDTIELGAAGGELIVRAEAAADQPLTGLEIVVNGQMIEAKPEIHGQKATLSAKVRISEGSWIAARCTERDDLLTDAELAAYNSGQNAKPSRMRFAHTSPVYVKVNGKGSRVERSIAEARRMLDAFEAFAMRTSGDAYKDELKSAIQTARERLLKQ